MYKLLAFLLILFTINSSHSREKSNETIDFKVTGEDSLLRTIDSICEQRIEYFVNQLGSVAKLEEYYGKSIDSIRAHCKEVWIDSLNISPAKK